MDSTKLCPEEQAIATDVAKQRLNEALAREYEKGGRVFAGGRIPKKPTPPKKVSKLEPKFGFGKALTVAVIIISLIVYYHSK